jgi:hypothetical protein
MALIIQNPPAMATKRKRPQTMAIPPVEAMRPVQVIELLNTAIAGGAQSDVILKLLELQERTERNAAIQAFNSAMADAKAKIEPILKNQEAQRGTTTYKYEDMAQIARTVDPVITPLGLNYRYRASQTGANLTVICVIAHKNGHFEETFLTGAVEPSVDLTPMQSLGATATMLQRLTIKLAFGLAAYKDSDCTTSASGNTSAAISSDQLAELELLAKEVNVNMDKLLTYLEIGTLSALPAAKFSKAKTALEMKRGTK